MNDIDSINMNNLNVKYFCDLLNKNIINGYIQKIQSIDFKDFFLKFKINTKENKYNLIVGKGIFVLSKYNPQVKITNKGFSLKLNQLLDNKRIINIEQINLEKIIRFEFIDYFLYFELFSSNNIILTDKNNIIIDCLVKEEWKDRSVKPKKNYLIPSSNSKNIFDYVFDENDFNKNNIVSDIISKINVPPNLLEFIIKENNIDKNKYNSKDILFVLNKIKDFYNIEFSDDLYYINKNNKYEFYNFKILDYIKYEYSLNEYLDENIIKKFINIKINNEVIEKDKKIGKIENILNMQKKKLSTFLKQIDESNEKGNWIYENYETIEKIQNLIKLGIKKGLSLKDIEKKINDEKINFKELEIFKSIDEKNKKILFTHHQQ